MKANQHYANHFSGLLAIQILSSNKDLSVTVPQIGYPAATSERPVRPEMETRFIIKLAELKFSGEQFSPAAFDEIVRRDIVKVQETLTKFERSRLPYRQRLCNRLSFLEKISIDEFPQEDYISPDSLQGLLCFLTGALLFPYPEISLSADGSVCAEWRSVDGQHIAIQFRNQESAMFVASFKDEKLARRMGRISVDMSIDNLLVWLGRFDPLEWSYDARQPLTAD